MRKNFLKRLGAFAYGHGKRILNRKLHGNIVLVYTMGKVGSSSVYSSLKRDFPLLMAYHVHFLSNHMLEDILPYEDKHFHHNIREGKSIQKILHDNPDKRIKIITLVRDPIQTMISGFFQNWPAHVDNIASMQTSDLTSKFLALDFNYPVNWFENEFKLFTGIDLFKLIFNKEVGYSIYASAKYDILVLQLEKLTQTYTRAINEFLYVRSDLRSANISNNKDYSYKYQQALSQFKPSDKLLRDIYASKFVTHFYSQNDVDGFIKKWKNKI